MKHLLKKHHGTVGITGQEIGFISKEKQWIVEFSKILNTSIDIEGEFYSLKIKWIENEKHFTSRFFSLTQNTINEVYALILLKKKFQKCFNSSVTMSDLKKESEKINKPEETKKNSNKLKNIFSRKEKNENFVEEKIEIVEKSEKEEQGIEEEEPKIENNENNENNDNKIFDNEKPNSEQNQSPPVFPFQKDLALDKPRNHPLTKEDKEIIFQKNKLKFYPKGKVVSSTSPQTKGVYYIKSGRVHGIKNYGKDSEKRVVNKNKIKKTNKYNKK